MAVTLPWRGAWEDDPTALRSSPGVGTGPGRPVGKDGPGSATPYEPWCDAAGRERSRTQGEADAQRPVDGGRQATGNVGDPTSGLRHKAGQKKAAGRVMMPSERKTDQRKSADVGAHGQMPPVLSKTDAPEEQAAAKKTGSPSCSVV